MENDLIGSWLSPTAPCEIQDFGWLLLAQVFPGSANDCTTASISHAYRDFMIPFSLYMYY